MKKLYLLILFLTVAYVTTFAQSDAMEKLEAAKIALITERLELTPDQVENSGLFIVSLLRNKNLFVVNFKR